MFLDSSNGFQICISETGIISNTQDVEFNSEMRSKKLASAVLFIYMTKQLSSDEFGQNLGDMYCYKLDFSFFIEVPCDNVDQGQ